MTVVIMRFPGLFLVLSSIGALAPAAGAQLLQPWSDSFLAGKPVTLSVDELTLKPFPSLHAGDFLEKAPGVNAALPAEPVILDAEIPKLDKQSVFKQYAHLVDIDAMSLGLDLVFAKSTGEVDIPSNAWGALTISVDRDAQGAPGSVIRNHAQSEQGAAAVIFSYVLEGSHNVLPSSVGVTQVAAVASDLNLWSGDPAKKSNIDSIDYLAPLLHDSPEIRSEVVAKLPGIYFSLTETSAELVPDTWFENAVITEADPSGASILFVPYIRSTNSWGWPMLVARYDHLGLAQDDELTALAFDSGRGQLLFSADKADAGVDDYPIMFAGWTGGTSWTIAPYHYLDANGNREPVSDKIGLRKVDRVDVICALDPGGAASTHAMRIAFGRQDDPHPSSLYASAFRADPLNAGGDRGFYTVLNGIGTGGRDDLCSAVVTLYPPGGAPIVIPVSGGYPQGTPQQFTQTFQQFADLPIVVDWSVYNHVTQLTSTSNRVWIRM